MEFFESLVPVGVVLLCLAGIVALIALAYFLVSLIKAIKNVLTKVDPLVDETNEILSEAKETLAQAREALEKVKPALDRIDPLMERITLTVDAANLEIMRVDQILEDVNTISGNISKATDSLDSITSVPLDAISSVTGKIRQKIAPLMQKEDCLGSVANTVDQKLDCVEDKVAGAQARADVKRAERDETFAQRSAAQDHSNEMSSNLKDAFSIHISSDTETVKDRD